MAQYTLNDIQYLASVSNAKRITLHWAASDYNSAFNDYHLNIYAMVILFPIMITLILNYHIHLCVIQETLVFPCPVA